MTMWSDGAQLEDPLDLRRLGFLHPPTVRHLLQKGSKVEIARYFPLCENLVCLKRFMGSKLPLDFGRPDVYDMKDDMEPYLMSTIYCNFRQDEQPTHQFLHREAARRFVEAKKSAAKNKNMNKIGKETIIYPVAEMRELNITAMSSRLRLFNDICKGMNRDTLVSSLEEYRDAAFDGFRFARFMCTKLKLALPTTAAEYLEFCCVGSPFLRTLIYMICREGKFLSPRKHGKFIVTEDVPLNAMFIEWVLNMLGVNVTVYHAGLTNAERTALQEEFNDPKSKLSGMVLMYDVGGTGLNLWCDCWHVFMCTGGKNESAERQGAGRVIRVSLKRAFWRSMTLTCTGSTGKKSPKSLSC